MIETLNQFHFLRPLWFLALLPALLLCLGLWLRQRQSQQWVRYIAPNLLPFLLDQVQIRQKKWPLLGVFALWLTAVTALAGPVWQKIPQPVERNTEALVICWDLSPSMLAEDVKPSRLVRSRLKLIDLLQARRDGQVALIAYAAEAYTVTPLTDDRQTLINLLPALSPTTLPSVGSNPEMALTQALQLLKDGGVRRGNILFLTDEIEPAALDFMADELSRTPHQLTLWGVGTEQGAPIPLPDGGFAKNRQGEIVVARLNEGALQTFAKEQRAYYLPMLPTSSDIETLVQLLSPQNRNTQRSDRVFDQWFEHGQYLPLVLLPFVAWLFRRGLIFTWLLLALLPFGYSPRAQALSWQDLWLTEDQQAQRELQRGNSEAATRFTTPERRGAALFAQQEYDAAAKEFAAGDDAADAYNRGNALAHAGRFEEAVKAFDQALKQRPGFPEARDNRAIAQQLADLQKQQQSEQQQQSGQQQNSGDQQDAQNGQEQGSDQQQSGQNQSGEQSQDSAGGGDQEADAEPGQSGEQEQSGPDEMSDEEAAQRAAREQEEDEADAEENPYSAAQPKEPGAEQAGEEQRSVPQQVEPGQEAPEGEKIQGLAEMSSEPMTEEEQMLEQWLRKVPDDPSGLMRNKFKYQYLQRRQSLRDQGPYSNNQAEQRW